MSWSTRHGFTLTEVLVVIGICVIVVGLMLPSVRRVREPANRTRCQNNLRQVMIALQNYCDVSQPVPNISAGQPSIGQHFPTGCQGGGDTPEGRFSWMVAVLPMLEQDSLFRQFDFEKGYTANLASSQTVIKSFLCPAAKEDGNGDMVTHYVAMAGIGHDAATRPARAVGNGFMGYDRYTSNAMIEDGTSNTIALAETRANLGPWARGGASTVRGFEPTEIPVQYDGRPFGGHASGMIVALADCSTRSVSMMISAKTLAAAITIADKEELGTDW
ncbi:MAG: DUF1559 domain-containing protein [Gemmataceae bacterium]